MDHTVERRAGGRRVPLRMPVALAHDGVPDGFGADAIDLSASGMAMKAGCLPDVGDRLACRFDAVQGTGGSSVGAAATGEVMWARLDDDRTGTFGLRFVELDAGAARLIARMLTDQKPTAIGLASETHASAASLEIDGLQEPVPAKIDDARGFATFEQPLDLFKLGRVVRRRSGRVREGSIAKVELRVLGNTPMLAVTVDFERDRPFGELELELDVDARQRLAALGVDLEASESAPAPAPDPATVQESSRASRVTETEFTPRPVDESAVAVAEAPAVETPADQASSAASQVPLPESSDQTEPAVAEERVLAAAPVVTETLAGLGASEALHASHEVAAGAVNAPAFTSVAMPALPVSNDTTELWPPAIARDAVPAPGVFEAASAATEPREPSMSFALPGAPELRTDAPVRVPRLIEELDAEIEAMALLRSRRWPPRVPDGLAPYAERVLVALRQAWAVVRAKSADARAMLVPWLAAFAARALPPLRGGAFRARTAIVNLYAHRVAPSVGAARRLILGAARRRRRRTTMAAPLAASATHTDAHDTDEGVRTTSPRRWLVGSLVLASAIGVGAYAIAPVFVDPPAPETTSARIAKSAKGKGRSTAARVSAAAPGAAPVATPAPALPSEATAPASSAHAVDLRDAPAAEPASSATHALLASDAPRAPVAAATAKPVVFGAREVRHAKTFTLRMTGPVANLRGTSDAGGFTVVIAGSLALDPAGPIAKQHSSVERAMILNRGGESQLTVRFAPGKKPAFQVRGTGSRLEILIEGA